MTTQNGPGPDRDFVRGRLEELAVLSRDLDKYARMLKSAPNIVAAEMLGKRVNELTATQNKMMRELVELHPDQAARTRFDSLSRTIDDLQGKIKNCKAKDELRQLEADIDRSVTEWVHHFQTVVAQICGAPPPAEPIFSEGDGA